MKIKLIGHGAEAKIYLLESEEKENEKYIFKIDDITIEHRTNLLILKHRYSKKYRNEIIDKKFIKYRTRTECKILNKLSEKIPVPKVIFCDEDKGYILMEYIDGIRLSEILENLDYKKILKMIGEYTGIIHKEGIVHGDLTTSNIIYKENNLYFIDFGLSYFSRRIEDYATDLHLFKESLEARHWKLEDAFKYFLEGYRETFSEKFDIIYKRLRVLELRGRYKSVT